jgi:hypothetical protein
MMSTRMPIRHGIEAVIAFLANGQSSTCRFYVSLHQSDFAATGADRELKDSSATAIVASAFVELDQWGTFVCLVQRKIC